MKPQLGKYIKIVIVFIQNSKGKFLIQRTSKEKGIVLKRNYYGITARK